MKSFRKFKFIGILIVLLVIFTYSGDRRTDKSTLVIMTLNAEFMWDGVDPEEGQVNFPWKHSQTEAEEHMERIAEIIISSNPDIVNLVEVENIEALKTLNDKFLEGRGYEPYLIKGKDTYTGQDVALLTRIDTEEIDRDDRKGQSGDVQKGVSKNYYAKLDLGDNTKIAFIGLHFLSGPNREDRIHPRQAQADVIKDLAVELNSAGYNIVILGDFNDYDGDEDSIDHINSDPRTAVLEMIKAMKTDIDNDDLINAASFIQQNVRYTAFWDKNDNGVVDYPEEYTSIDHILLSPNLAANVESVEIPHEHDPRTVTDHFPVVVRLKFNGGTTPPSPIKVRMTSLLPNPPGDENVNEEVTIKNFGSQSVNMNGWKLRDKAGKTWSLNSLETLNPGEEKTIKRNGQSMALNNNGDTVDLIDPNGNVVHTVTYSRTEEGEIISPIIN